MKRKLYRVNLPDSGEIVIVRPLSPIARRELILHAENLYPMPDPRAFDKPVENPLVAGQLAPGEQNPEYLAMTAQAAARRKAWTDVAVIDSGVVINTPEGREVTIARLAEHVTAMCKQLSAGVDTWLATVKYGLIYSRNDVQAILDAAYDTLREDEVRGALETFRGDL